MIGGTTIKNNKVVRKQKPILKSGSCKLAFQEQTALVVSKSYRPKTFKDNFTLKAYQIFHQLNCKSRYLTYLIERSKCQIQYVGKSENEFKIRLNFKDTILVNIQNLYL